MIAPRECLLHDRRNVPLEQVDLARAYQIRGEIRLDAAAFPVERAQGLLPLHREEHWGLVPTAQGEVGAVRATIWSSVIL